MSTVTSTMCIDFYEKSICTCGYAYHCDKTRQQLLDTQLLWEIFISSFAICCCGMFGISMQLQKNINTFFVTQLHYL